MYEWRTKLLTTCKGHGQSGWSPFGCEGFSFHAMCKHTVPASGWSSIGWRFSHKFKHPKSIPCYFCLPLNLLICLHIYTEIWNSHTISIDAYIYIFYRHICIACRCWISNKGQYFPRFYRGSRPIWSKPCKRLGGYFDHTGKKIHCGKLT